MRAVFLQLQLLCSRQVGVVLSHWAVSFMSSTCPPSLLSRLGACSPPILFLFCASEGVLPLILSCRLQFLNPCVLFIFSSCRGARTQLQPSPPEPPPLTPPRDPSPLPVQPHRARRICRPPRSRAIPS